MRRIILFAAILMGFDSKQAPAQRPPADFPVNAEYRGRILDGVAEKLGNGYFNAERAELMRKQLSQKKTRATYDTCSTAGSLTTALTRDLQRWSNDRHVRVVFSVEPRPMPKSGAPTPAMAAAELETARARNFGFHALTRLDGNVGYLEIGRFDAAAHAAPTLAAAMQFLANTDALIIDLRYNGGGRADMVAHMASYFMDEQRHLLTLERRNGKPADQIWSAAYVPGPRYLGKPIYVLTSSRTFSGAEGLAYDLKHFANATIVGEKTRGGANPGAFQQLDEHFAVFVPTARVIHAATNSNWDADGITPDVSVPADSAKSTALAAAHKKLNKVKN